MHKITAENKGPLTNLFVSILAAPDRPPVTAETDGNDKP